MAVETDTESTGDEFGELVAAVTEAVPSASPDEAAAIAVALSAHMTDQQRAAAAADSEDDTTSWAGREWAYSGRVSQTLRRNFVRVPSTAPDNEWTAAGRVDRM